MNQRPQAGFTLLELIVVIGIFGVFAAMAYGGLDRVLTSRKRIEQSLARTEEYQRAYQRIRADFESAAPRGVRDGEGTTLALMTYDGYYKRVEFTRGGWANLLNLPRPTLQRVGYFLDDSKVEDKKLMRRTWPVLDRAPQTEPVDTPLLEHVESLSWRFMDYNRAWSEVWPTNGNSTTSTTSGPASPVSPLTTTPQTAASKASTPPIAVEMTLKTKDWGEMRMLFRFGPDQLTAATSNPANVAAAPANTDSNSPGGDSSSSGKDGGASTGGGSGDSGSGDPDSGTKDPQ